MSATQPGFLLLLHGFTGHPESWTETRRLLESEPPVLSPALLGHAPDTLELAGVESFENEVDRIASWVRNTGGERGHLCGYSLGSRVGLGLLIRHPELFVSATLIGVNPGLSEPHERASRRAADAVWQELLESRGLDAFSAAWQEQRLFESQRALDPTRLAEQQRIRARHDPKGLARALQVLGLGVMPNYVPVLSQIRKPINLLCGELDERFLSIARDMANLLPAATLGIVPHAGHNLPLEAAASVANCLEHALAAGA